MLVEICVSVEVDGGSAGESGVKVVVMVILLVAVLVKVVFKVVVIGSGVRVAVTVLIEVTEEMNMQIWGVVISVISDPKNLRKCML